MFDISFGEMMVIGAVALVVIGPERLPKVARTVGSFVGKAQRYAAQVRDDINRQIELEELRKTQQEIQAAAQQFEQSIQQEIHKVEAEAGQIQQQLEQVRHDVAQALPGEPQPHNDDRSGDLFATAESADDMAAQPPEDREAQAFRERQLDLFAETQTQHTSTARTG